MRRFRDPEEWRVIVEEWAASGQSLRAFCREHEISKSALSRWFRRYGYGRPSPRPAAKGKGGRHRRQVIEVELPAGLVVRFPADSPPDHIARVVTALTVPA